MVWRLIVADWRDRAACCGSIPHLGPIHTTRIQMGVAMNLTSACREAGRLQAAGPPWASHMVPLSRIDLLPS